MAHGGALSEKKLARAYKRVAELHVYVEHCDDAGINRSYSFVRAQSNFSTPSWWLIADLSEFVEFLYIIHKPFVPRQRKILKMIRQTSLLLIVCSIAGFAYAMDCNFGQSKNIVDKYIHSCPGVFDSSSKSYCCWDLSNESVYCCDYEEFIFKTGLGVIVPAVIAVVVVVMFIICCISCLCCSCCPWYRRRHRGTVYGKGPGPSVIQVIQTPGNTQTHPQAVHNAYAYPAHQMAMPSAPTAPPR